MKTISKIALIVAMMGPVGAYAAATDAITTKGYVDSGLIQKQNKLTAGTNITIDATTNTISAATPDLSTYATDAEVAAAQTAAQQYADANDADTVYNDTVLSGRVTTAEGKITALETNSASKSDLATKQDKLTAGANITLGADGTISATATDLTNYATIAQADAVSTAEQTAIDTAVANKADKATTLSGYGITDAMAKHTCVAGQMLLTAASGAVSCVDVENGTYSE